MKGFAVVAVAAVVAAAPAVAAARDRLAVLMDAGSDAALADNLTEVAISVLAERRDRELVGMQELRGRLAATFANAGGVEVCLSRPACLAEVGAVAEVTRAVIGTVRPAGDRVTLALSLTSMRTGVAEAQFSTTVASDIPELVAALRAGLGELFAPPPAAAISPPPPPPVPAATPPPTSALVATRLGPDQGLAVAPPVRRRSAAAGYVTAGTAALAVVALSGAVVRGTMASAALTGGTRAMMQEDLERRQGYAEDANRLYVLSGALAAISAAALIWWLRGADDVRPAERRVR
jgi:hypothetical protein